METPAQYTTTNGNIATRRGAFRKMVLGCLQLLAGLYELWTGEDAPKISDILRG